MIKNPLNPWNIPEEGTVVQGPHGGGEKLPLITIKDSSGNVRDFPWGGLIPIMSYMVDTLLDDLCIGVDDEDEAGKFEFTRIRPAAKNYCVQMIKEYREQNHTLSMLTLCHMLAGYESGFKQCRSNFKEWAKELLHPIKH